MLLFINQAILMVMATVLGWRHSSELFEELRQMGLVGKAKDQGGLLNGVVRGRQMGLDIFHQISVDNAFGLFARHQSAHLTEIAAANVQHIGIVGNVGLGRRFLLH